MSVTVYTYPDSAWWLPDGREHRCELPQPQAGCSQQCSDCDRWWFAIATGKSKASAVLQWASLTDGHNPYRRRRDG